MESFVSEAGKNIITLANIALYHGSARINFLSWVRSNEEKIVYFSLNEKQSEYHPFDGYCARGQYVWREIPCVYKFQTRKDRPLKLLNIRIEDDRHVFANTNVPLSLQFILSYNQDISNGNCTSTLDECNRLILHTIKDSRLDVDGYVCFNDQSEVGLNIVSFDEIFRLDIELKIFNIIETYTRSFNDEERSPDETDDSLEQNYQDANPDQKYNLVISEIDEFCAAGWVSYDDYMMKVSPEIDIVYTPYMKSTPNVGLQVKTYISSGLL